LRVNDIVYTNGGTYGGLYGIAAADGSQRFFQSLEQQDSWSPAYFSGQLFTCVSGHFRKHNLQDGTALSNVQLNANGNISTTTTLVFGPSLAYLIAPPNLVAIDPTQGSTVWTANGTFSGLPAVAGGSVFAISAGNLVARNAQSGALEWTFIGDMALSGAPVIANGIVYTSSAANLYAVDVATHQQVDHQAIGGGLIVGGRRLIVAGAAGKLTAYTLSP
jgi:outer membrane protein assembly factor BamB